MGESRRERLIILERGVAVCIEKERAKGRKKGGERREKRGEGERGREKWFWFGLISVLRPFNTF